jgi:carbonic anhydrase/acetyltransferase-like protein (isoleucine patch superfamily)
MIRAFQGVMPRVPPTAYVDEAAVVIGDVIIGEHSSVWPCAVVRGDDNYIRIGSETNIQDNCVLHGESELYGVEIGDRVTVGHNVVLHGCRIGSECLIAMGAIVLNNVQIGEGSVIAAGTVVPEHTVIPPGSLCMGIPAAVRRNTTEKDRKRILGGAASYVRLKEIYLRERK